MQEQDRDVRYLQWGLGDLNRAHRRMLVGLNDEHDHRYISDYLTLFYANIKRIQGRGQVFRLAVKLHFFVTDLLEEERWKPNGYYKRRAYQDFVEIVHASKVTRVIPVDTDVSDIVELIKGPHTTDAILLAVLTY